MHPDTSPFIRRSYDRLVVVISFDRQVKGGSTQENDTLFVVAQLIRRGRDS